MDRLISMYIDDELSLDEKVTFVENVHASGAYFNDTVALLSQEKQLKAVFDCQEPKCSPPAFRRRRLPSVFSWAAAAGVFLILSFVAGMNIHNVNDTPEETAITSQPVQYHRFVIFREGVDRVDISGSFTDWQRVPLLPVGSYGYWEVQLQVPYGEHRYSFIVDGDKYIPDPTVPAKEADDFGAMNSVIDVKA
ncbi:glycogen-binding domain-containing protein [Desulforhopalus singaporensis]|uniref:Glycogen recognition site of AMP-activated protein kinase n=1 Tax=Desulforhopalus singaporensis TaxID=91360 RepID=A0A1H0LAQ1_9BACT|nr:glycogen-binding domain-containing protein [Desulforhopalus singaporensis]SDO65277.1 Glycogen recognition site of AMP-activated protein kinase [Desulforhopalus singaporensis]